jgi:hypothetical protein
MRSSSLLPLLAYTSQWWSGVWTLWMLCPSAPRMLRRDRRGEVVEPLRLAID